MRAVSRPDDEKPLHAIVEIVVGLVGDLVSNASRHTAHRHRLSTEQLAGLRDGISHLLSGLDLQESRDSSDKNYMTDAVVAEQSNGLTDGPFELVDHAIDQDEVNHLRRLGAPAWMTEQFQELADGPHQPSPCSV